MATGIIYGTQSGIIRRVVVTDDAPSLPGHVGPGESMLQAPDHVFITSQNGLSVPDLPVIQAYLTAATGIVPQPARCAVLDNQGNVVMAIMADPLLDRLPGHTLFQDENASPGYIPDANGVFYNPATANAPAAVGIDTQAVDAAA